MSTNKQKLTTIHIEGLACDAIIGTNDWERNNTQPIIINIAFTYDAANAIINDDLAQAIDYDALSESIIKYIKQTNFFLLESLCEAIVSLIIENTLILQTKVSISKPKALEAAQKITVIRKASRA